MWELRCVGVEGYGNCSVCGSCVRSGSYGVRELHFVEVAVWGVAVWESYGAGELRFWEVACMRIVVWGSCRVRRSCNMGESKCGEWR